MQMECKYRWTHCEPCQDPLHWKGPPPCEIIGDFSVESVLSGYFHAFSGIFDRKFHTKTLIYFCITRSQGGKGDPKFPGQWCDFYHLLLNFLLIVR